MSLTDQLKKASLRTAFSYLEKNPEKLRRIVEQTGAHSTDLQSPETADHLCDKCEAYAKNWQPTADRLWQCTCGKK